MAVKLDEPLGRVAYVNARILDPAEGWDGKGGVLTDGEAIADAGPGLFDGGPNKVGKQRMRLKRAGFKFGVELNANIPGMIGDLHDFG